MDHPHRPAAPVAAPARPPRLAALDAARALGVVAMVCGHTLDALLSPQARAAPWAVAYWKARGLTAPLFLLVAGWAVTVAFQRAGRTGWAAVRARLPRVLLLLAVGVALRWPGWGVALLRAGDRATWAHLLAFDALHVVAVALLCTTAVLALPLDRDRRVAVLGLLAVGAVTAGLLPPAPLAPSPEALPSPGPALALLQAAGGTSPFPLFPWVAYLFAGAIVGLLVRGEAATSTWSREPRALALVGGALVAATCWTGVGTMPPGHPALVAFRIGAVLLLLAALWAVPAAAARRLAPLGRASLFVYALHLPVVYGWSRLPGLATRIGPTLGPLRALAVAAAVLAGCLAARRLAALAREVAAAGLEAIRQAFAAAAR